MSWEASCLIGEWGSNGVWHLCPPWRKESWLACGMLSPLAHTTLLLFQVMGGLDGDMFNYYKMLMLQGLIDPQDAWCSPHFSPGYLGSQERKLLLPHHLLRLRPCPPRTNFHLILVTAT